MSEERNVPMRPNLGDTFLALPITFDYSGGRRESQKSARLWSIGLTIFGFILSLGIILNKDRFFLINLVLGFVIFYIILLIVRFFILKEGKLRLQEIKIADNDFKESYEDFWGIYSIDPMYPHIVRFRNGKSGVFVSLSKDVVLGKYTDAEFEHEEAIGDAYNICGGSNNISIIHTDYMDIIGSDERLDESFASLSSVKNPDMVDLLTDIYTYQKEIMSKRVTSFDVYLFMWTGSDNLAWSEVKRVLKCFMQANYRGYHLLGEADIRDFSRVLMNLEDFSVIEAMSTAFVTEDTTGVSPIKVIHSSGDVEIVGKTIQEKKDERALKEKELILKKEENKRRRKSTSKKNKGEEDEEIDLFN